MSRKALPKREIKQILGRLRSFVERYYGSWVEFEKVSKTPESTTRDWKTHTNPRVPDVPSLVRIARVSNLSLNWLLLGGGSPLREREVDDPAQRVDAAIEARLKVMVGASQEEFLAAWDRMTVWDEEAEGREDIVLRLAVLGVKARFEENLRHVRHYARIMRTLNSVQCFARKAESLDEAGIAKLLDRIEEELR